MKFSEVLAKINGMRGAVVVDDSTAGHQSTGAIDGETAAATVATFEKSLQAIGDTAGLGEPQQLVLRGENETGFSCFGDKAVMLHMDPRTNVEPLYELLSSWHWDPANETNPIEDHLDESLVVCDRKSKEPLPVLHFEQGRQIRYRIGLLGLGAATRSLFADFEGMLSHTADLIDKEHDLWATYEVMLLAGDSDQEQTSTFERLTQYRPNLLVLVNAGSSKQSFSRVAPQNLVMITRDINRAALQNQTPYSLVWMLDELVPGDAMAEYERLAREMGIDAPVTAQFRLGQADGVIAFAQNQYHQYLNDGIKIYKAEDYRRRGK